MLSLINTSSPKAFLRNSLSSCFFSSDNDIVGAGPQNEMCTFSFATIKRKFSEIVSSPLRAFSHLTAGRCISVSGCINVHNVNCNLSTMDVIIIITRPKPAYGRQGLAGSWGQDTDEVSTFLVFLLQACGAQLQNNPTWDH